MPSAIAHQQRDQCVRAQVASFAFARGGGLGVEVGTFARQQVDQRFAAVAVGRSTDQAGALRTDISGSGRVNIGGSADQQDIEVSGSGEYDAAGLPSQTVSAEVSGSGDVVVTVSGLLKVDISGSGSVTYSGDPKVESSVSGSGKVIKK